MKRITIIFIAVVCFIQAQAQNQAPDISLVFYIEEGTPNGTRIGSVGGDDPDGDALTYTATSGNENEVFLVDASSGEITVNKQEELIFAISPTFVLLVTIDDSNGGMATATVTINLNERPLGLEVESALSIYPNPIVDRLYVESDVWDLRNGDVQLYGLDGRELQIIILRKSSVQWEVDVSSIPRGIYMLHWTGDSHDQMIARRILVQ